MHFRGRCAVTDRHPMLRLGQVYFLLWTAIVFNVYVFSVVTRVLAANLNDAGEVSSLVAVETQTVVGRLKWFPLLFVVVRYPPHSIPYCCECIACQYIGCCVC
jgi:hypothetical protein